MPKKSLPYLLFGILGLAFALGLLIFDHVPAGYANQAIDFTLYGHLHAVLNYDSPEFLKDAVHPAELLEHDSLRQSRPGLVLLVAGLNQAFSPIRDRILPLYRASGGEIQQDEYIPYTLYVLVNFLLLGLSFFTYWHILQGRLEGMLLAGVFLGGLLVFNDVVKAFLWTPHTQLFNVLVPLFCLYAFQQVRDHQLFSSGRIFLLAFLAGLGLTAYGTFALFLPSVFIALIWIVVREKVKVDLRMIVRAAIVVGLTILPLLGWVIYVRAATGSFYSAEIAQGQFGWILPLLRSAPFQVVVQAVKYFGQMVLYALAQAIVLPAIVIAVFIVTLDRKRSVADRLRSIRRFPSGALILSGLFLLFFALSGLVIPRTAFSGVPPLVAGTAVVVIDLLNAASVTRRRIGNWAVVSLVLLQAAIVLFKVGPFS